MTNKTKQTRFENLYQEWVGETERNNAVLPDNENLKKKLDKIVEKLLKKAVRMKE